MSSEQDPRKDLLRLSVYGMLAQFWITLNLKDEMWEDDAKDLLLLQKAIIEEGETTLQTYLDEESMKRFRDYVDRFKARMVFTEDAKAKRYRKN